MLDFIVSWIDRQFGDRLSVAEKIALCARMLRQYQVDPSHYDHAHGARSERAGSIARLSRRQRGIGGRDDGTLVR
jgi:hypothetical protein